MNVIEPVISDEVSYAALTSIEHRKKYAQFFTPERVADLMCRWVIENFTKKKKIQVLEPAIGLGIFSRILRNKYDLNAEITGYDVDGKIISDAREIFSENNINVKCEDYLQSNWDHRYDIIICNPPYFKFHDYDNLYLINHVNSRINADLSGFTNLYALFILKSINQLNNNGCAAYIVPSEFLNADYGKEVKMQMLKSGCLCDVIVFDFEENIFDNALTTACILLFRKTKNEVVNFFYVKTLKDLINVEDDLFSKKHLNNITKYTYHYHELLPAVKWRNYYQNIQINAFENLAPLKKYCKVMRGIATGANDYFVFNNTKRKSYGIDMINLLPCATKGIDIPRLVFTEKYCEELINKDKNLFLIDCTVFQNDKINDYIKIGIEEKINERFLTKSRNPWYAIENKKIADLWVGVFNREGIKVILNKAKILNLTTFHGVYIHPHYKDITNVIFAFFLTNISKKIFAVNGREYGNGLNKFEPNDFNNSMIYDFKLLSQSEIDHLNDMVNKIEIAEDRNISVEDLRAEIELFFEKKTILE